MNKYFKLVFTVIFLLFLPVKASADVDVSAESAIVIDANSRRVLFEKNAYSKKAMASTTKIMTALVAIDELELDDIVTVSPFAASTEGSSIWLSPGEHMSVEDLLYGLMLSSGNDAATALAEHTAGSVEAFTVLMNKKAREIGALNTNFTNPHGLPDDSHYTTAYDLALISAEAIHNSLFRTICGTKTKTISWEGSQWNRSLSNHNKLLKMYDYAIGIKTGYTKKAGRCLVSAAEKDGQLLIAVTLSAPDDWNDHIRLLDYCFDKYNSFTACKQGDSAGVYVPGDKDADKVGLIYKDNFTISVTENEIENIELKNKVDVKYPIKSGQKVGVCEVYFSDNFIGCIDIIAANDAVIKKNLVSILIKLLKGLIMQ
ncbi:MAG: D-alanyl-D-alanine carboxypeptidase [Clostridia bacterium]|nr:D-alanyl-D-alanine carboxypeptidase [Clostridia bacterium]